MKKFICFTEQFLLCFILNLRAIYKYKPPGAYIWRGDLTEGFSRYDLGSIYLKGLIFEILRYFVFVLIHLELKQ